MCGIFGYWDRERRALRGDALAADGAQARASRPGRRRHLAPAAARRCHRQPAAVHHRHRAAATSLSSPTTGRWPWCRTARSSTTSSSPPSCGSKACSCAPPPTPKSSCGCTSAKGSRACASSTACSPSPSTMRARTPCTWCATASASSRCMWPTTGARAVFASEIKAMLPWTGRAPGLDGVDLEAIHHYLSFNYIPAPWTIWRGVRHVMPGTWMKFTRGRRADPALVEPGRAARAGLRVRRLGRGVHVHPGRRDAHPAARRRALGRLPVGRRRLEHDRRP